VFFKRALSIQARVAVLIAVVFYVVGTLLFTHQALSRGSYYMDGDQTEVKQITPVVIKTSTTTPKSDSSVNIGGGISPSVLADVSYDFSSTRIGVYTGPGDITGHRNFETWLGKTVPYASDYIDYKGGWSYDFHDSNVWLMKPWGRWVSQTGGRLVLGVPMLENSNVGQFDAGVNGSFDTYFKDLAGELVSNNLGSSIIRLGYEANCSSIGPWQAEDNPEGYKQLFRHEVAVMRSVSGAAFQFDWTVCNGLQNGHALNSFDSFYPGDDAVDIIGMDIYDVKWQDTSVSPQGRWNYLLTRQLGVNELISYAAAHGKPLSYPEWGLYRPGDNFAGGGDNPYFIQQMAGLISSTKPAYQAYFDLDWGSGVLSDFPQGQAAFKQIFGM
jgi:hypothetical protein